MQEPLRVRSAELKGANVCNQCEKLFDSTDSLRRSDFCSFRCEHLWAEEHGDCAIKVRGRYPRIGYIDGEVFTFPGNIPAVLERVRNYPIDLFTFLQHPARTGVLYKYPVELDNLAVLSISTFEHWWTKQARYSVRKQVKKAERAGIDLSEEPLSDELLEAITNIYNEVPTRQERKFRYYGVTLARVRELTCTFERRSIYITARLNGSIIGFIKLITQDDYATVLHILSLVAHRDKSPTNALLAHSVKVCAERNISQLSYGHFTYGKKDNDGIQVFKTTNGFERLDVPRYFAPQTTRGHIALKLGLHHRLREHVPEPMAAAFRSFRARWYKAV